LRNKTNRPSQSRTKNCTRIWIVLFHW